MERKTEKILNPELKNYSIAGMVVGVICFLIGVQGGLIGGAIGGGIAVLVYQGIVNLGASIKKVEPHLEQEVSDREEKKKGINHPIRWIVIGVIIVLIIIWILGSLSSSPT